MTHKKTYRVVVAHPAAPEAVIGFRHTLRNARALSQLYILSDHTATVKIQLWTKVAEDGGSPGLKVIQHAWITVESTR